MSQKEVRKTGSAMFFAWQTLSGFTVLFTANC